jgi:hypothetical protein
MGRQRRADFAKARDDIQHPRGQSSFLRNLTQLHETQRREF